MNSTFSVLFEGNEMELTMGVYPGGEVHVELPEIGNLDMEGRFVVTAKLRCADGIQALCQIKSIIDQSTPSSVRLMLGYTPYSRQDRIAVPGDALAAKVFATQLNNLNFDAVMTVDNHSDVITALLDRAINLTKDDMADQPEMDFFQKYDVFVAPDLGAAKEVEALAKRFGKVFVQGLKSRDPKTGIISNFSHQAPESSLDGKRVLIIDDLCDGGGTFIGLAENLDKWHKMESMSLFVTHGIFSRGTETLAKIFTMVYTTNTLIDYEDSDSLQDNVKILPIFEF